MTDLPDSGASAPASLTVGCCSDRERPSASLHPSGICGAELSLPPATSHDAIE